MPYCGVLAAAADEDFVEPRVGGQNSKPYCFESPRLNSRTSRKCAVEEWLDDAATTAAVCFWS